MLVFFTKLKSYGMERQIFALISTFLSNTRVVLDGKSSQEYSVDDEFPQGSILGPTLFPLDINDLPDVTCDIAIDADDTTLYSSSRTYVGLLLSAYTRFWTCVRSHVRSVFSL